MNRRVKTGAGERQRSLRRAWQAACRLYGCWPGVRGIALGTKFVAGQRTPESECIQFLVYRKMNRRRMRALPRYVWGRRATGAVDRRYRFPTDVLQVGAVQMACVAGEPIAALGQRGTATLVFQNRNPSGGQDYFLVTCGHVVGRLQSHLPSWPEIECEACGQVVPVAEATLSAVQQEGRVEYDIALAHYVPRAVNQCHLTTGGIAGETQTLHRFLTRQEMRPGLNLSCHFPVSGIRQAKVDSYAGWVRVNVHGRVLEINNAFLLQAAVRPGDSGGLLYIDDSAAGMLFARSTEGWAWFHPLEDAIHYLNTLDPELGIQVFDS